MRTATQWLRATMATAFLLSCGALPSGTLPGIADESSAADAGDLITSELPGDALTDAFSDVWSVTDSAAEVLAEVLPADIATDITADLVATDIATDTTTSTCFCGDSICSTTTCGETAETCPADCKGCGNGICEPGEGPKTCAIDCCGTCGDGKCKGYDCGESSETCAQDCGSACGNKVCDKGESPQSCAQDCVWQACGNGVCEASDGGPTKCPEDCGSACGDGVCQGGEDFIACPIDCGYCGDGFCSVKIGESTANCMADCKGGECDPNLPSDVTKCDDGNPCTMETCPPAGVCHHPPIPGPCDDGSVCTTGDHCQFGACVLTNMLDCSDGNPCTADLCDPKTGCQHTPVGGACTDGDACTVGDSCKNGGCSPGVALTCDDGNACTNDSCAPASGCTATDDDQNSCIDGNLCTIGDHCVSGVCTGAGALGCDDGNPCTNDVCAPESGCAHLPNSATCSDGNACTTGDGCINAVCTPGSLVDCNDQNACTADGCNIGTGCTHKATSAACDDNNPCTTSDTCKGGSCQGGPSLDCDDGNVCTKDSCDAASGCTSTSDEGATCSDGDVCTAGDSCHASACVAGSGLACDDGNPCTLDGCNAGAGCTHKALSGACEDGNPCTSGDACFNAVCMPGPGLDCTDGNPCTVDACDSSGGCHHTATTGACTDGNACTIGDLCKTGSCQPGGAMDCGDGNPCTDDSCSATTGCVHLASTATCEDGNSCTVGDVCANTVCTPGSQKDCNDEDPCTSDACQSATGCVHKATSGACDDGDPCTVADSCKNGVCHGGGPASCDDGNACTFDQCDSVKGCFSVAADGNGCSDGNVCTVNDSCAGGVCQSGAASGCDDGNPCTTDACDAQNGCSHLAANGACDDGSACTLGDTCWNGACTGGSPRDCSDNNPCTTDACDAKSGCKYGANTAPCSDNNACTLGDVCGNGGCQPGSLANCGDGNPCTDDGCNAATGCTHLANAATCTDSNVCTSGDACKGGTCLPGAQVGCDDGQPCTVDACDPVAGCQHTPTTGPCNDGDLCTTGDTCAGGSCAGKGVLACDDSNSCTLNKCNSASGCTFPVDSAGTCSDGNACTIGDHCAGGTCLYTTTQGCDDGLPCTVDSCDTTAGCQHVAAVNGAVCDDGNLCTTGDNCQGSACVRAGDLNCEDGLPCTTGSCVPASGCVQLANSATCSDGNPCTLWDHCTGGQCVPTSLVDCDDKLPCTADSCDPADGTCVHSGGPMNGSACSDGSLCTPTDACLGGLCVGSGSLNCDDSNPCTDDSCIGASGCAHTARTGSCEDGNKCTTNDTCQGGTCSVTAVVVCNDGNACTADSCDPTTGLCVFNTTTFNGNACSDGDLCTQVDTCSGGVCLGSSPKVCTAIDQCHSVGTCASTTGVCSNPNKTDGVTCDDGNKCTLNDACSAGVCSGPTATDCNDHIACTQDSCSATAGCVHNAAAMNGLGCDDGSACTQLDLCANGGCVGGNPKACTALDTCHAVGSCDSITGLCSNPNQPDSTGCDDGSKCTPVDHCLSGVCTGTGALPCADSDPCTNDSCIAASGCDHQPNTGNACDDGSQCTSADTCQAGVCTGTANLCTDGNICTDDTCVSKTCSHSNNTAVCEDGDACTVNDHCGGGSCRSGSQMFCTDNSVCTSPDYCVAGSCFGGPTISCDDSNPCTIDSCDAVKGCQYGDNGGATCGDYGTCGGGQCVCPDGTSFLTGHCPPIVTGIALAGSTLAPAFDLKVVTYTGTPLPLTTSSPNLTVTAPTGVSLTLSVNGAAITTLTAGQATPTALRPGDNTLAISAIHAGSTKTYTMTVTRMLTAQQAYVKATNTDAGDQFGNAIAISGDTLVVGAPNEAASSTGIGGVQTDNSATKAGAVYVYRRTGTAWAFEAYIKASNTGGWDNFGASVAIDGDVLAVGAPGESSTPWSVNAGAPDNNLSGSGAAYVFYRQNGAWYQRAMLKAANASVADGFGESVAVSGTTVAVGTSYESSNATGVNGTPSNYTAYYAGAAYVFTEISGVWTQQAYLKASNAETYDYFGRTLSLSGNTLVVGAPGESSIASGVNGSQGNNSAPSAGAAYVFTSTSGVWSQQAYLKASNTDASDGFGGAVSVNGDTIVVGANGEDGNGLDPTDNTRVNSGAAYAFVRTGGTTWTQQGYLKAAKPDTADLFGSAVFARGDWIGVGSPGESGGSSGVGGDQTDNSQVGAGALYLFARKNAAWSQVAYVKASNPDAGDAFATAIAFDGNTAVVGAINEASSAVFGAGGQADNSAASAGAAYIFSGDTCFFGLASECDDGKPCTTDSCGSDQLCQHAGAGNGATCDGGGTCSGQACSCPAGFIWDGVCRPGLNSLTTSAGTPLFKWSNISSATALNEGEYALSVPYATTSLTVTEAATAGTISMTVNGSSVALAAPISLVSGATSIKLTVTSGSLSSTYVITVTRPWATQNAYVKASNPDVNDVFGTSVAIDGNTMVVGATSESSCATMATPQDQSNNACANAGAAYVYQRQGDGTWLQQAYLKAPNPDAGDNFGASVAISGDTIVVGALGESANAATVNGTSASTDNSKAGAGAAYVFTRTAGIWTQQAYLKAPATCVDASDAFGNSVAISGDTVVVGAYGESSNAAIINGTTASNDNSKANAGAAYVFVRNTTNSTWSQQAFLKAPIPDKNDHFGDAVAISGDTIVVGAVGESSNAPGVLNTGGASSDNSASYAGAGYVFTRNTSTLTWSQQAFLKSANPDANDGFGGSVAVSGDSIVVGAINEASAVRGVINGTGGSSDNSKAGAGAAYVFFRTGSSWAQQAFVKPVAPDNSDSFGGRVAISGDTILIGAFFEDGNGVGVDSGNPFDNSRTDSGAAFAFTRAAGVWSARGYIKASNPDNTDWFGVVALSGTTAVICAQQEDSAATGIGGNQLDNTKSNAGAAYIFTVAGP